MWIVSPLALAGCVLLFFSLGWNPTIKFFCIWAVVGLVVYFLYARRRSHLAPGNEHLLHAHTHDPALPPEPLLHEEAPTPVPDRRLRPAKNPAPAGFFLCCRTMLRDSLNCRRQATSHDQNHLRHLAGEIITNVRGLSLAGWTPATSSNFSRRLDERHAAITVSGRDKGRLTEADIMVVDFDGNAVGSEHRPPKPCCTPSCTARPGVGCVLHTRIRRRRPSLRACTPAPATCISKATSC